MADHNPIQAALNSAVLRLLRPLCRLLLRHNVPVAAFEELAKPVYVEVSLDDFGLPARKSPTSRASIRTGLTRTSPQSARLPVSKSASGRVRCDLPA